MRIISKSKARNFFYFSSLTALVVSFGCASNYQQPESFEEKMARFQARNLGVNTVNPVTVATIPFAEQAVRGPASLVEQEPATVSPLENRIRRSSNRNLYFLGLYNQYLQFKSFIPQVAHQDISFCPAFHSSFITAKKFERPTGQVYHYSPSSLLSAQTLQDSQVTSLYPELTLSMRKESSSPRVIDYLQGKSQHWVNSHQFQQDYQNAVNQALQVQVAKIHYELEELCEYGQSDNYYVFENLVTHSSRTDFNPNSENMQALLKTGPFANMAILSSLKAQATQVNQHQVIAGHYVDRELKKRVQASWAKNYFVNLTQYR